MEFKEATAVGSQGADLVGSARSARSGAGGSTRCFRLGCLGCLGWEYVSIRPPVQVWENLLMLAETGEEGNQVFVVDARAAAH